MEAENKVSLITSNLHLAPRTMEAENKSSFNANNLHLL